MGPAHESVPTNPGLTAGPRAKLSPIAPTPENPLWTFAVSLYERPGVRPACLRLQDEVGLDVDVVLTILWIARQGWACDAPTVRSLLAETAPIRAWIEGQRRHRRAANEHVHDDPGWRPVADAALAAELAAERYALHRSYGRVQALSLEKSTDRLEAARAGLTAYAKIMAIDGAAEAFAVLVSALAADLA